MKTNLIQKFDSLTKTQKLLVYIIAGVIVVDLILGGILLSRRKISAVRLECVSGAGNYKAAPLTALDSYASNGLIKDDGFANFKFSQEQKDLFKTIYEQNETVALTVRVQVQPTTKQAMMLGIPVELPFQFGFLSAEDFSKKGKFIKQIYPNARRILIQGDLQHAPEVFDISFAIQKSDDIEKFIPEGFFIYSNLRTKILAACVVPSQLGFDFSEIPFYGFGPNGGRVDFEKKAFDFAGGSLVFPVQNTKNGTMPEFVITLDDDIAFKSGMNDSVYSEVNIGGEKLRVKSVVQANEFIIPAAALKAPFARLEIVTNPECIKSIVMRSVKIDKDKALRTDPGLILKYKASNWRNLDYEVFEWDRKPGILFFDTRNYLVQEKMFSRLAYFVEKEGYKGTLLTNEQLEGKHGYNAHDYSAQSMAEFFNKASRESFKLNDEELQLKQILIKNGLFELLEDGITVEPKDGGIVSISQESADWMRTNFLAHEGWHTVFFCDEEFRNFVGAVYYTMDPDSLDFLVEYFKSQPGLGYDVNDEYLMHNEMMAYIMQQRLSEVRNYFIHLANRGSVMQYTPKLAAYVRKTEAQGFEDAAIALNDYVFDKYGIICGNIALITR